MDRDERRSHVDDRVPSVLLASEVRLLGEGLAKLLAADSALARSSRRVMP